MIYLKLFLTFFKIGLFTFGGGYAMLPLIQEEVAKNGYLDMDELINFVAISESTPGPFAINISTYVGIEAGGFLGAVCSTLGVVAPSFIVILCVAKAYDAFRNSNVVKGMMSGLKPVVVGLIAAAAVNMGKTVFLLDNISKEIFTSLSFIFSVSIFALTTVLSFKKINPIIMICISAALGIALGYIFDLPV